MDLEKIDRMQRLLLVVLCVALIGQVLGSTAQEGQSFEGFRCDSCVMECSSVCGSRAFKTCCFNYIKKRSSDSTLLAHNPNPEAGGNKKITSASKMFLRRSASWGPPGDLYQMPYALEAIQDDRRWYPYNAPSNNE